MHAQSCWVSCMQGLVRRILDHMRGATPQRGSFADLLLRTNDPKTGRPLNDLQLRPEISALFFAGVDTTGHTGTFCLYALPLSKSYSCTALWPLLSSTPNEIRHISGQGGRYVISTCAPRFHSCFRRRGHTGIFPVRIFFSLATSAMICHNKVYGTRHSAA